MIRLATAVLALTLLSCTDAAEQTAAIAGPTQKSKSIVKDEAPATDSVQTASLDTATYSRLQRYLSNGDSSGRWPVKHEYPKAGAVLPFNRVIAYYGNLYSTRMGALGEFPKKEMLAKLQAEVKKWSDADSAIKSIPALHYIAVTAQGDPGKNGLYRLRMPHHQIDTVLNWAKEINGLVFIDIQVGLSSLQKEMPEFEKYLALPNVHFGIDPEFSMKGGERPGSVIGTFDAADINYATEYLASIVKKYNLPPKILVVHRFTQRMVTNYKNIKLRPEVQIVMDMDGWGVAAKKKSTYYSFIAPEPVQFTGFKLFYNNDTKRSGAERIMTPQELLQLRPRPIYIQYQ